MSESRLKDVPGLPTAAFPLWNDGGLLQLYHLALRAAGLGGT